MSPAPPRTRTRGCEAHIEDRPTFRSTKLGGTRLHLANPHWYVDGGTVRCPAHQTDEQIARVHRESWEDARIRETADQLGIHVERVVKTSLEWKVTL